MPQASASAEEQEASSSPGEESSEDPEGPPGGKAPARGTRRSKAVSRDTILCLLPSRTNQEQPEYLSQHHWCR